jgi:diguanylate cyclase (GGDEF)-like protein
MKISGLQYVYLDNEERNVAVILLRIVHGLLAANVIVILSALFWGDRYTFYIGSVGFISLIVPIWILFRGYLRISGLVIVTITLVTVTTAVTYGQGIHDIGIIAYPMVTVITSLLFQRRDFFILSFLTLCAMAWLVFGEAFGLFVSNPIQTPVAADFIVVAAIFLVAVLSIDSLAENTRKNMRAAQVEIANRKIVEEQLRFLSNHDSLTGVYNRAFFEEELARLELSRDYPVSIIITDVDNLKKVNDSLGHVVGDELLRRTCNVLSSVIRAGDVLARIGGDEFAVILPRTDKAQVEIIHSRIQSKLKDHNAGYPETPLNFSIGLSTAERGNLKDTVTIADREMYLDKSKWKSKKNNH